MTNTELAYFEELGKIAATIDPAKLIEGAGKNAIKGMLYGLSPAMLQRYAAVPIAPNLATLAVGGAVSGGLLGGVLGAVHTLLFGKSDKE